MPCIYFSSCEASPEPGFDELQSFRYYAIAGWSSLVARRAHNPKVVGSNPTPATKTFFPFSDSPIVDFARSICLRSAKTHMQVRPAIQPTLSDGRTLKTGSAESLLRFLRGPSVRLDRLRWYKHARPRCLKAHRHQGSSQADGLGHRSCPLHGRSPQSVRHEDRTLSTGGSSRHESPLSRLHAR